MTKKKSPNGRRSLPRYVQAVKQKDGGVKYRSWFPLGQAGSKKWTRLVDDPDDALRLRLEAMKLQRELPVHVVTLGQAVARTQAELDANNREGHAAWFRCHAKKLLAELGAETPLPRLTPARLERFRDDALRSVSASTVRHYRSALSLVVNHAMRRGELKENPLRRVKWPKVEQKEAEHLPLEKVREILTRIRASKRPGAAEDADAIALLFLSGLRRSELARLTAEDVDLRGKVMWVKGKARAERVAIAPDALPLVERMVERAGGTGLLLPGGADRVGRIFRVWRSELRLPKFSPHVARHSFCTWLVEAGHPLEVVQKLARHRTIAMTQRYYHGRADEQSVLAGLTLDAGEAVRKLKAVE